MPFTAQNLMPGEPRLATAHLDQPVRDVLTVMLGGDYSQLPVVDEQGHVLGMITQESILEAVHRLGFSLDKLQVQAAYTTKVRKWRAEDDLFDVLEYLKNNHAVLITDSQNCLTGIITTYDTTEYFRQQAEDMMLIEEVEAMLKQHVLAAFSDGNGILDEAALSQAIAKLEQAKAANRPLFKAVLEEYLALVGRADTKSNDRTIEAAFDVLEKIVPPIPFEKCSFNDLVELLLRKDRWEKYGSVFGRDRSEVQTNLKRMGEIRNSLAHFRDITPEQQQHLQKFVEWFGRYEARQPQAVVQPDFVQAVQPNVSSGGGKYDPLASYLMKLPANELRVRLTMDQIEQIIQDDLPPSAKSHKSWWANDSVGHIQSKVWLSAGWKVIHVSFPEQTVTFARQTA